METEGKKRSRGSSKTPKKDGKHAKAQSAEEEARRREAVRERVREKMELEKRALQVVERLLVDNVSEDFLRDCAWFITPANYKDVIEERSIAKLCGYPLCPNPLGKIPAQRYKISTKTNKVYDITERKCFCSNFCYKASKVLELQIPKTPLWIRSHERPPQISLMKKGDSGSLGEEVKLAQIKLVEKDVENPQIPEGLPSPKQRPDEAWISHSPSSSSDSEQEQDFVSSVVSQRPGRRVRWADLPERTEEGEKGGRIERRSKQKGGRNEVEIRDENSETEGGLRGQSTDQPRGDQVIPEGPDVDQLTPKLHLCTLADPVTAVPHEPTPTQAKQQPQHTTPDTRNSETESRPQADPPPGQTSQADLNITQVGMSKSAAKGLRDFIKQHSTTKAESLRQNLLEGLRRTLREWHTDETVKFLYGSDSWKLFYLLRC